jgi:hypothetical protein
VAAIRGAVPEVFDEAAAATLGALRAGSQRRRGLYTVAHEQLTFTLILSALRHCGGDSRLMARALGVSHSTAKHYSRKARLAAGLID